MSALPPYRLPAACALVLAAPLLLVAMPPMVDFPAHEAVVGVLRHWGDAAYFPADLYVHNWGHPNQLQYLLAWPLAYVVGTTKALELVVAVSVVAIILGTARLARHLGRPAWVGLLAAPAAIGWNLHWGHIANLLGLGALLCMLPELDRFARTPRARDVPLVLAGLALLYCAHEGALAIALVAVALLSLAHGGGVASFALRAAPCLVATAAALVQLRLQHLTPVNAAALVPVSLGQRLATLPQTLVGFYDYARAPAAFGVILSVTLLNAARGLLRVARTSSDPASRLPRPLVRHRFVLLGLVLLASYFVLPASANGVFFFYHRFLGAAWCVLVVATAAPMDSQREDVARVVCATVPAVMLVLVLPPLLASDRAYGLLDAMLPEVDRGSGVFSAELDHGMLHAFNPRGFSTRNAQGHVVALRGGRALADYTQSPIAPARVNPAFAWDDVATATFLEPADFRPKLVFTRFRYVFLHVTLGVVADAVRAALRGEARLVERADGWLLFESAILKTPTLDASEPAPDDDPGDTLQERLRRPTTTAERP